MCIDLVEFNKCEGEKYYLVIIDMRTMWAEIFPCAHPDAMTEAKVLVKEIIPQFGIPERIYGDNGTHFVNNVMTLMAKNLKIELKKSLCISSTKIGRFNGTIKSKRRKKTWKRQGKIRFTLF